MSEVRVTALEPGAFGVEIDEGDTTTGHRVRVPPSFVDDHGLGGVDESLIVEESLRFLLDREPATAILAEFSLDDIARFFDDYDEELRARLSQ